METLPDTTTDHSVSGLVFRCSSIHGTGGFATVPWPRGSRILPYRGERISKAESNRRCERGEAFIFHLDEYSNLDGNVPWNPARFFNHSCAPNSEAQWTDGDIWIVATRDIAPGEEITFDYGYDLEAYREHPCYCRARECRGFIVAADFADVVRHRESLDPPNSTANDTP